MRSQLQPQTFVVEDINKPFEAGLLLKKIPGVTYVSGRSFQVAHACGLDVSGASSLVTFFALGI